MNGLEEEISDFFFFLVVDLFWEELRKISEKEYIVFDGEVHEQGTLKQKLTVSVMLSKCQILFKALYIY